jgi:anaerobic selenocysteine-containing dehydrogenase
VRMKAIQDQHGADSVAWIGTGQMPNEELAFLGALAKFGMGVVHGDGNTRQCMATAVTAYKESFGFDAPPYTYKDFEESDVIVLVGSNLCIAHPIMWQRVLMNRNNPEIIVVDPRRTETATAATQHYAIQPKSDLVLLYGLARILIERGWVDREFIAQRTKGFEEFEKFLFTSAPGPAGLDVNSPGCDPGNSDLKKDATPKRSNSDAITSSSSTPPGLDASASATPGLHPGRFMFHPSGVDFSIESVAAFTGLSVEQLNRFAETIHAGKRVSFWWTMGVNQGHEATRTAQAIINLALMTGNIGRPGTGANSITGQCNAMGSRLFSNTTNLLGGHDFTNAEHREKVARALRIPVENIPQRTSWAYDQILDGIQAGKIKGLWIIATNTAHSWIQQERARHLLRKLDFLVVQDMYATTETAQQAHLVLPAAGWGEKSGTFINSERRIGLLKKVSRAPGQALSDFKIFQLVAHYWGCAELFRKWTSPEAVFQLLKRVSAGQPCDITGIEDYRMLDECGGVQWPLVSRETNAEGREPEAPVASGSRPSTLDSRPVQERRLFADGKFFHADGRAKFIFEPPRPVPEPVSKEYPFVLLTGRGTSAQWHTQTRTGKSDVLKKLYPARAYVEVSPEDAEVLRLETGARVQVSSRRGEVEAAVFVSSSVAPGQVFMPMHYAETNELTHWQVDPYSRQPNYKSCAVKLARV